MTKFMFHRRTDVRRNSRPLSRCLPLILLLAILGGAVACSKDTPASTSKPPVTLDPDVFLTDQPQLFKTAKAETRALPTQVTANGVVSPDVNRTIHVTSLGGGRVIDLKVKLGDTVNEGPNAAGDFQPRPRLRHV